MELKELKELMELKELKELMELKTIVFPLPYREYSRLEHTSFFRFAQGNFSFNSLNSFNFPYFRKLSKLKSLYLRASVFNKKSP